MTHRTRLFAVALLIISFMAACPEFAWADAQGELTAGRAALDAGDLDKAISLLTSAAQALPQSVEAQMALGDCHLKLGQTDKALAAFQTVLKLSPDHAAAKRIVAGLTGSQRTFTQKLALARSFLDLGAWSQAEAAAQRALLDPGEANQREEARLVLTKARLFSGNPAALEEAVRLMEGGQFAAEGRVLAALSLLVQAEPTFPRIQTLLKNHPAPAANFKPLDDLATLLVLVEDEGHAEEISAKLSGPLSAIPTSPFRSHVVQRCFEKLAKAARVKLAHGAMSDALTIVWPMVSAGAAPGDAAVLKPIDFKGGWIDPATDKGIHWLEAARLLAEVGRADVKLNGAGATLLGSWLAAETLRQAVDSDEQFAAALELTAQLAEVSRPAANRRPGDALSRADEIEILLLRQIGGKLTVEAQQNQWIELAAAVIARYEAAGDPETGLAAFSPIPWDARAFGLDWTGPPLRRWLHVLAEKAAQIGAKKFQEAAATLAPDANKGVNKYDVAALTLYGKLLALLPSDAGARSGAQAVIDRYLSAEQFEAATDATRALYGQQPGKDADWALLRLKLRRAMLQEQKLLASNRQLDKASNPLIKEALAAAFKQLTDHPTKDNRHAVIHLLDPLVHRYASLERRDLADAIIALVTDAKLPQLDDWIVWTQANLQGREGARAFAAAVGQATDPSKLTILPQHKAELDLLIQLIGKYPDSDYFAVAVQRVADLANLYQEQRAFDVATGVLASFLKAQPNLKIAPQLEFQSLQIQLAKANAAFNDRKDKVKPPEKLSPDFQAVIDALAAYLKAHPTGEQSPAALNELLQIARTYGQAGAWPVAREVLARFATAAPDFRSPGQLKLWQAATYLGELDLNYGLSLLAALSPPQSGSGTMNGEVAFDGIHGVGGGFKGEGGKPGATPQLAMPANVTATGGAGASPESGISAPGKSDNGKLAFRLPDGFNGPDGNVQFDFGVDDKESPNSKDGKSGDVSLAMIRQSEQRQISQIAMLRDEPKDQLAQNQPPGDAKEPDPKVGGGAIALPGGSVLSEAEMKRQDDAADKAYAILIDLVKTLPLADAPLAQTSRTQIVWLFAFFEGQLRTDRSVALINRFLTDRPADQQKVTLAFRALQDELVWAGQRQRTDRVNKKWLDARHELFEAARKDIGQFVKDFAEKADWVGQARLLAVDSFEREAQLAAAVSPVRSAGLLVNSVDALLSLYKTDPAHPGVSAFPERMWNIAERLRSLHQEDLGVYVLSQIPIYFPANARAQQAVLRIAELYAANLTNPLRAVETYQEYLSVVGDNEAVRAQIFSIAQQLAVKQRFLEALHVYGVFVDSFPTDPRAPQALLAIGQIHQTNEVWKDALAAYQRILNEYPAVNITPQVKLAMAECHINLSEWNDARQQYNEFILAYPQDGQIEMAKQRMEILKNLNRYQTLLSDNEVQRNKDDAQFQIGMIVNERLGNHVKAVIEFRKVVKEYPKSSQAAAAQYEIGKALLALNKLDEARIELLKVPQNYSNSPFANDALYFVGQSYEHQAQKLAGVTIEGARAEAYEVGQRAAYSRAWSENVRQVHESSARRDELRKTGDSLGLELDEAKNAFRTNISSSSQASNATIFAEQQAETLSALQVANRQDRINEAYRQAVAMYGRVANEYPLGDMTDKALLRMAQILETELKDRDLAMATYQKVVKFFPGTPVAEDAAWKVAKFYEAENKYKEAVDAYRDFIRNYPASGRVPDAQYAVAEDLEQLGRWVEAMDAYETFRQKFNTHPKAQTAQEEINWIRAYRR